MPATATPAPPRPATRSVLPQRRERKAVEEHLVFKIADVVAVEDLGKLLGIK